MSADVSSWLARAKRSIVLYNDNDNKNNNNNNNNNNKKPTLLNSSQIEN